MDIYLNYDLTKWGFAVMTPRELTKQAFRLYDNIRLQSYKVPVQSDTTTRLDVARFRAYSRYQRRLKLERGTF
ncbi:MAG TPA: hypothetical protein VIF10_09940 [Methylobacter sp.]